MEDDLSIGPVVGPSCKVGWVLRLGQSMGVELLTLVWAC